MKAAQARALFDESAATYDPVNRAISLGLDRRWRAWVAEKAVKRRGDRVLDAMTGTGEVAVQAARLGADVTALDVSPEMLRRATERSAREAVSLTPMLGDATQTDELPAGPFDSACLSFGMRYVDDPAGLLGSLRTRIRPGGRLVVLEFCVPAPGLLSTLASVYFFRVLPHVGGLLGGHAPLYAYLRDSTREIGRREDILGSIVAAGFEIEETRRFGFGLVLGVVAERREPLGWE